NRVSLRHEVTRMKPTRRKWLWGLGATALTAAGAVAGPPSPAADEAAVRRVLDQQVAAWNRRDLGGYMAGDWDSPALTFYSGGAITGGWQATLERYRQRYQGEGKEMGTLDFSDVKVEMLDRRSAFVRGRWHLVMSSGKEPKGLFTLIVRRRPEGWRIVHDHT